MPFAKIFTTNTHYLVLAAEFSNATAISCAASLLARVELFRCNQQSNTRWKLPDAANTLIHPEFPQNRQFIETLTTE